MAVTPTAMQEAARAVILLGVALWLLREAFLTWHSGDLFETRSYRRGLRAVGAIMGLGALAALALLIAALLA